MFHATPKTLFLHGFFPSNPWPGSPGGSKSQRCRRWHLCGSCMCPKIQMGPCGLREFWVFWAWKMGCLADMLHAWEIYLHWVNVGKYTIHGALVLGHCKAMSHFTTCSYNRPKSHAVELLGILGSWSWMVLSQSPRIFFQLAVYLFVKYPVPKIRCIVII